MLEDTDRLLGTIEQVLRAGVWARSSRSGEPRAGRPGRARRGCVGARADAAITCRPTR